MNYILYVKTDNYVAFDISKKSGAARRIHAPQMGLKILQGKLLQVLSAVYQRKTGVHGFAYDRTILSNARAHVDRKFVFNVDISDFFPSINFGRVRGMLMGKPYRRNAQVATILAQICCHENCLPQGAPTSPIISNMVCAKLDSQLFPLAIENRMVYTRYADDITFSTTKRVFPKSIASADSVSNQITVGDELRRIIESNGFRCNEQKVRLQRRDQRQQVTGLTVNWRPNVKKTLLNQARAMLRSWTRDGLEAAEQIFWSKWDRKARRKPLPEFKKVIKGKIDFIGFVKGRDSGAHAKLYWEYCRLDPKFRFRPISVTNNASDLVIQETLWVLEGHHRQGTGVYIQGLGIVTCLHVIEDTTWAHHWRDPKRHYPIKTLWHSDDYDLAVLAIDAKPRAQLCVDRELVCRTGEAVMLYGFPDYHLKQAPVVTPGQITGMRSFEKMDQILISSLIVAGNSGGPVLDSKNHLIGIASRGPSDNAEGADKSMSAVTRAYHLPTHL